MPFVRLRIIVEKTFKFVFNELEDKTQLVSEQFKAWEGDRVLIQLPVV